MRLLWALAHGLESTSKRMLASLGVTGPQRLVLRLVGHYGSISAGDLARALHIHPSSLTGMLRRLTQAGLLRRRRDPVDGRRALLTLTAAGKKLNALREGTVESVVDRALRATSKADIAGAERLLQKLAALFEADERE
jgi:DNA-binding MarR family transcriptional regulator